MQSFNIYTFELEVYSLQLYSNKLQIEFTWNVFSMLKVSVSVSVSVYLIVFKLKIAFAHAADSLFTIINFILFSNYHNSSLYLLLRFQSHRCILIFTFTSNVERSQRKCREKNIFLQIICKSNATTWFRFKKLYDVFEMQPRVDRFSSIYTHKQNTEFEIFLNDA